MPISGEMRLRQLILALVALTSICIGVAAQRSRGHAHVPAALSAGAQPPDFAAPAAKPQPKLLHVPGLERPVSATPIVVKQHVQRHVHANRSAPKARAAKRVNARPKPAMKQRPSETTQVEVDNRSYAGAGE